MPQPSLYRIAVGVLALACAGNLFLVWLTTDDDVFATIVGFASGALALVLVLTAFLPALVRLREEALLLALMVWLANFIEYATQEHARWQSQVRLCSFYLAFAGLALGTYLAQRMEREVT